MSSPEFNFARAPFTNERLPRLCFLAATVVVLGLTLAHGVLLARYLLREQEEMDIKVEALEEELAKTNQAIQRAQASLAQDQNAVRDERTRFLARLYRQKGFSWTGLFNELEEITPAPVRITSIAPFEERGQIHVTLNIVGRTLQDVLEMVRQLEGSSFFATVFPVDEAHLDELGESGVAATLRLEYVERVAETKQSAETDDEALSTETGAPSPKAETEDAEISAETPNETPDPEEVANEEADSEVDETSDRSQEDEVDPLVDDLDSSNEILEEAPEPGEPGEQEPGSRRRQPRPRGDS